MGNPQEIRNAKSPGHTNNVNRKGNERMPSRSAVIKKTDVKDSDCAKPEAPEPK
jgi:hypothetical protein